MSGLETIIQQHPVAFFGAVVLLTVVILAAAGDPE